MTTAAQAAQLKRLHEHNRINRVYPQRDDVRYRRAHTLVGNVLPRWCEHCGATRDLHAALRHGDDQPGLRCEITPVPIYRRRMFSTDPAAYMRLCRSCHQRYDRGEEAAA